MRVAGCPHQNKHNLSARQALVLLTHHTCSNTIQKHVLDASQHLCGNHGAPSLPYGHTSPVDATTAQTAVSTTREHPVRQARAQACPADAHAVKSAVAHSNLAGFA
jgi:hypothetical protein